MSLTPLVEDTFAGPGGWDEGLRMLGVTSHVVGYEWDRTPGMDLDRVGGWL